jgi:hypothetical protein
MPSAHLDRGLVILGAVATLIALANAFLAGVFYVLFTCFDTCLNVGNSITSGYYSDLIALVVPLGALTPAVTFSAVCWVWELVALRRQGATRAALLTAFFPVFSLLVMIGVTLLTSLAPGGGLAVYGTNVWYGSLAIALWPALVTIMALAWRGAAPASSASFASPPSSASPPSPMGSESLPSADA